MEPKAIEKQKFEGFEKVTETFIFFKFGKDGDYFHGTFLGSKEITSKLNGEIQTVWICKSLEDYFEQGIFKNDICYISEKSAMVSQRMLLKENSEFILEYEGEKKGQSGRKYKSFNLYRRS